MEGGLFKGRYHLWSFMHFTVYFLVKAASARIHSRLPKLLVKIKLDASLACG